MVSSILSVTLWAALLHFSSLVSLSSAKLSMSKGASELCLDRFLSDLSLTPRISSSQALAV